MTSQVTADKQGKVITGIKVAFFVGLGFLSAAIVILHPCEQAKGMEAKGQFDKALVVYTNALKNPYYAIDPNVYFERGYCKRKLGDYSGAIADLQKALEIRQKYPLLWGFKGFGIEHYLDYTFHVELGRCFLGAGDLPMAIKNFQDAMKIEKCSDVYHALASAHERDHKMDEAEANYKEAVEIARSGAERERALHLRGLFHWRRNNRNEALKDLNAALDETSCAEAYTDRAYIYNEQGQYKNAIDDFTKSIDGARKERAYHGRAIAEMELGDFQSAAKDLAVALELDPTCKAAKADQQIVLDKLGLGSNSSDTDANENENATSAAK